MSYDRIATKLTEGVLKQFRMDDGQLLARIEATEKMHQRRDVECLVVVSKNEPLGRRQGCGSMAVLQCSLQAAAATAASEGVGVFTVGEQRFRTSLSRTERVH